MSYSPSNPHAVTADIVAPIPDNTSAVPTHRSGNALISLILAMHKMVTKTAPATSPAPSAVNPRSARSASPFFHQDDLFSSIFSTSSVACFPFAAKFVSFEIGFGKFTVTGAAFLEDTDSEIVVGEAVSVPRPAFRKASAEGRSGLCGMPGLCGIEGRGIFFKAARF